MLDKINVVLTREERADCLRQLLYEDPSPIENKYVVEIIDHGFCSISYFPDATCHLDALYRALSDYLAWHSPADISDVLVTAFCQNCGDEESDDSHTNLLFRTLPIPQ